MRIALQGKCTIDGTANQRLVTDVQLIAAFGAAPYPAITGALVRACKDVANGNVGDALVGSASQTSGAPGYQHLVALTDRRGFIVPHHNAADLFVSGTLNDIVGWVLYF
jgi:hypothetical protein